MQEHQPLDPCRFCDVGADFISREARPPLGNQAFHGLPFAIAEDPARGFIGLGGEQGRRAGVTHHHGEEDHLACLEHPFHEAREAIHRRIHPLGIPH